MTASDQSTTPDPVREFTTLMPRYVTDKWRPDPVAVAMVHAAIRDRGWTPVQLVKYVTHDLAGLVNPGPRVVERLRHAAGNPPVTTSTVHGRRPLCGQCEDGWQVDPETRQPIKRCPCRTGKESNA